MTEAPSRSEILWVIVVGVLAGVGIALTNDWPWWQQLLLICVVALAVGWVAGGRRRRRRPPRHY